MKAEVKSELYRKLPSVDELTKSLSELVAREGAAAVAEAARDALARLRQEIAAGSMSASVSRNCTNCAVASAAARRSRIACS